MHQLPGIEIVATYDTAGSARMIRDGNLTDTAAIASLRAAEVFGLSVLQVGIQDYPDNITRFLLIARDGKALAVPDKTTLAFALHNGPGALFKALSVFALRDIDMTKLESRPARGRPWEYGVLRGSGRRPRRAAVRPGDRAPCRVCPVGENARVVSACVNMSAQGSRLRAQAAWTQAADGLGPRAPEPWALRLEPTHNS